MRSTIYVNNTEVWSYTLNSYADSGTLVYDQLAELTDVPSGATIKMSTTLYGSRSTYNYVTGTLTYTIPGNLPTIIRPLIPQEIKGIGAQAIATSYGHLDNGLRYGEFPAENSNSATTGSISLGNCVGFKTIIDNGGNKRKIPVFKE